jgi:hypothetical protein
MRQKAAAPLSFRVGPFDYILISGKIGLEIGLFLLARNRNFWLAGATPIGCGFPNHPEPEIQPYWQSKKPA